MTQMLRVKWVSFGQFTDFSDVLIGDTLSGIIRLIAALLLAAALALGFMGAIILFGRFGL